MKKRFTIALFAGMMMAGTGLFAQSAELNSRTAEELGLSVHEDPALTDTPAEKSHTAAGLDGSTAVESTAAKQNNPGTVKSSQAALPADGIKDDDDK